MEICARHCSVSVSAMTILERCRLSRRDRPRRGRSAIRDLLGESQPCSKCTFSTDVSEVHHQFLILRHPGSAVTHATARSSPSGRAAYERCRTPRLRRAREIYLLIGAQRLLAQLVRSFRSRIGSGMFSSRLSPQRRNAVTTCPAPGSRILYCASSTRQRRHLDREDENGTSLREQRCHHSASTPLPPGRENRHHHDAAAHDRRHAFQQLSRAQFARVRRHFLEAARSLRRRNTREARKLTARRDRRRSPGYSATEPRQRPSRMP